MKALPSLKQLEYLAALAQTQHFGKAAELCHVTPSTLSAGIRDLEILLGVTLAERTKRVVRMTPTGLDVASRARILLRDAEDIVDLSASTREPLTSDLWLGVIPTVSPFLLPKVLPPLHEAYPDLRPFLREEPTIPILEALRDGEIDSALIALPFETNELCVRVLIEDRFQFACPPDHPLAGRKSVKPQELIEQPMMLLQEEHCMRGHALEICQRHGSALRVQFEATSLHTMVQMVAAGLGVTLLPQLAIDADVTTGTNICLIPLSGKAARQIALVWRPSSPRGAEFDLLADEIIRHGATSSAH